MTRNVALLLIGLGLAGICGAQVPDSQFGIFSQEGVASWYGIEFGGRPTASGEIFTPNQLTAAHPTLPFGTMLKVTNKHNNKSVVVRVNDRGPFVSARIIDLSQGAAEQLDMLATGTAPVRVESLEAVALPQDTGRPARPPEREILSPPAEPVPRASMARPGAGTAAPLAEPVPQVSMTRPGAGTAPAPAPSPAAVSVSETPAPVVSDVFSSQPDPGFDRSAPVRRNQPDAPAPSSVPASEEAVSLAAAPAARVQPAAASRPPATIKPGIPPADAGKRYRLQIGAFRVPRHAVDAFEQLQNVGLNPAYERSGDLYRVVLAGIKAEDVESVARKIGDAGFMEAVIREER
ncbi:MAG: septal ring lytic transglycosylase RlpA family protein [Spirochaetaceae bacterium]|nr:septal ring lytic transglycosylase RlpA family protein [Spirochaetaceae bacterium]